MKAFWQHVGLENSRRDFPRTLGTTTAGLREFSEEEIRPFLHYDSGVQCSEAARNFERIGKEPFQIWGFPSGAEGVLRDLVRGDVLALLDTTGEFGAFRYVGRVLLKVPSMQPRLSEWLWSEAKFPIVVLLRGNLIDYPWMRFLSDLGYGSGLKPMGRTARISEETLGASEFGSGEHLYQTLVEKYSR